MGKTNSVESPKGQNRHSHLMWVGAEVFGPLSRADHSQPKTSVKIGGFEAKNCVFAV